MDFRAVRRLLVAACLCLSVTASASTLSIDQVSWVQGSGGYLAQNSEWGIANFQFVPGDQAQFFPDALWPIRESRRGCRSS